MRRRSAEAAFALTLCLAPFLPAAAQDVRGIETCTAEKDMVRRTSCLQSNVEFLQAALTKATREAQDKSAAATREIAAAKTETAGLKALLEKLQADVAALRKTNTEKTPEKK